MPKTKAKIVENPGDLDRDELEMNYMLLCISLAKLMYQNDIVSISININHEQPPPFNLNVHWDADDGISTISTIPTER